MFELRVTNVYPKLKTEKFVFQGLSFYFRELILAKSLVNQTDKSDVSVQLQMFPLFSKLASET